MLHDEGLGLTARRRLSCLKETEDGFLIADEDFRLRGGGEATGRRQSGLPDYRMAPEMLVDMLLDTAHEEATEILPDGPPTSTPEKNLRVAARILLALFNKTDAARIFSGG